MLVPPTGCGSPGIGPFHISVDQPLPFETPISQALEPVPVVHQKSVIFTTRPSPIRSPVKHRSATEMAGAGPSKDDKDQPGGSSIGRLVPTLLLKRSGRGVSPNPSS